MDTLLHELTVAEIPRRTRDGSLRAVDLVEALLARIDKLEPSLQAWVTLDREGALRAAQEADRLARTAEGAGKALLGVPVGVKDIFHVVGLPTRAGSSIYQDFIAPKDATCIARLKAAGAIVLGKTVTTQFAFVDPPPTRNPWDPTATPGGSSTGSAVAVATRMVPAALGSQTVGSTIRPAAYNGIVGLKATYGRISRAGIFPLAWTLDTVGILARTVEDATLLLAVMAGPDSRDPLSAHEHVPHYRAEAGRHLAGPPRIGILRGFFEDLAAPEVQEHIATLVDRFRQAGAAVREVELSEGFDRAMDAHQTVLGAEAAAVHRDTLREHPEGYAPSIRAFVEQGQGIGAVDYLQAQRYRRRFREKVTALFAECDVVLTPSTSSPAPRDLSTTGDRSHQAPWTFAGVPALTIPSGLSRDGLPLGVQLVAPHFAEGALLWAGQWCERVLGVKLAPPVG